MSKDNTHFLILDMKPNVKEEVGRIIRKYRDRKAANYFKYFNAVELDLIVDSETGEVKQVKIPSKD
jgi:hypothetical protein